MLYYSIGGRMYIVTTGNHKYLESLITHREVPELDDLNSDLLVGIFNDDDVLININPSTEGVPSGQNLPIDSIDSTILDYYNELESLDGLVVSCKNSYICTLSQYYEIDKIGMDQFSKSNRVLYSLPVEPIEFSMTILELFRKYYKSNGRDSSLAKKIDRMIKYHA